jgi:hypothetical protein
MPNRVAILSLCALALLVGPTTAAEANSATQLPFANSNGAWLAVDPSGSHVFVSGGAGTSSIVVLNYAGQVVKTIADEGGASQMAVDTANHTLYVALHDQTAISEIDTQTLTETKRFSTAPYPNPTSLVLAGGKLWFTCFQNDGEGCHGLVEANPDGSDMAVAPSPVADYFFATALASGGPGNKYVAVGDSYGEPPDVDVYDVSGSTPTLVSHVHNPDGGSAQVRDMAFSPSGANLLLACGAPYYIESLATSSLLSSAQYPTGPYPIAVAATADGNYVAGGIETNSGNDVFVYPAGSTTPVRSWLVGDDRGASLAAHGLAFSPDASHLFAVAQDTATGHLTFRVLDDPTIHPAATTTSLTVSGKAVRYGSSASLKVQVTGTTSGTIDLYSTSPAQIKQLVATGTLKSGTATFTVKPTQNTTYSAELEEGGPYGPSASKALVVHVAPLLSIATRPGGKVRLHGQRFAKTLLTAKIKPMLANEPLGFAVQRRVGAAWQTTATTTFPLETGGVVHAYYVTNRAGQFRIRVSYGGDSNYASAKSGWKAFRVRSVR